MTELDISHYQMRAGLGQVNQSFRQVILARFSLNFYVICFENVSPAIQKIGFIICIHWPVNWCLSINTLRPRQNGRHFAEDIFKCIFLNENTSISIDISLKCVPEGRINNMPALVQIMAWRRLGDKPLSEPMMVSSLTDICVMRPQWVKWNGGFILKFPFMLVIYIYYLNSLWPGDAIWRHGTRSTLTQVMACCLTAPSHYLNQCWLITSKV